MNLEYKMLSYEDVCQKLEKLEQTGLFTKIEEKKTRYGYDVPHYTLGNGDSHIIIMGGTHGSEIISVDYVLKLMESIVNKNNGYENFKYDDLTIHFLPMHNPEGYIISTSAIGDVIKKGMSVEEIEKICKAYYSAYRSDDIDAKNNPDDHETLKKHQQMFRDVDYTCINKDAHPLLRASVKEMMDNYKFPPGCLLIWRANGSGVELNRNHPLNPSFLGQDKPKWGTARYNNILANVKGPLGVACLFKDHFEYEPENQIIINLIENLIDSKNYAGIFTFHSTMGRVYCNPTFEVDENLLSDSDRYKSTMINNIYAKPFETKAGYAPITDVDFAGFDEYLRVFYPGVILVELSKMGGNPIGCYGDRQGNYYNTMLSCLDATKTCLKISPYIREMIFKSLEDSHVFMKTN